MNIKDAKSLIKHLFRIQIETGVRYCVELRSLPGTGKSSLVRQVCEELSKEWGEIVGFRDEFLSTREQPDVAGFALPSTDKDGTAIMVRTVSPLLPRADSPRLGIILLDEFGQAAPEVQKPAAEFMLTGRIGESQLPITWFIVAASNRTSDRSGVHKSMAFIENRRMLINIEPNLDAWVDYAERKAMHPLAIAFAKWKPGSIFRDSVPEKEGPFATPRTLEKVSYLMDVLPPALFQEAAMGLLGQGCGAELVAFMRVASELPPYEQIIADPENTPIPTKPDASYAVMQMLAHRIVKEHTQQVFAYLKRMGKEFQVAGLQASMRKCPDLINTAEFKAWLKLPGVLELVKAAAEASR